METLFILQGKDRGGAYDLSSERIGIGRDFSNAIILHDREVSRFHAELLRSGGNCSIVDKNSSNGVYVNGRKIIEHFLADGDHIQLGQTLMLYTDRQDSQSRQLKFSRRQSDFFIDSQPDQSRIIHSMKQEEGEKFFQVPAPGTQEPDWLRKARSHLNLIYHTTLVVSQTLDIDHLLHRIMDLIFEWVKVDRGCVLLYSAEDNSLVPAVTKFRGRNDAAGNLSISQTILDYVLRQNEGVLTSDAQKDQRWNSAASIVELGIKEAICVPMQGRYGLVGVIYIDTSRATHQLPPTELDLSIDHLRERRNVFSSPDVEKSIREKPLPNSIEVPPLDVNTQTGKNPSQSFSDGGQLRQLSPDHLKLMIAIGHQAALAVEDTRYYLGMVQAERLAAVGQTVAVLSHHIKNILQGIRGGSYLIDLGLNKHEESHIRKGWGIVEKNQAKISDLILDMLTFSKERIPVFQESDLNKTVGEVAELMNGRCLDLKATLEWYPDKSIRPFPFDAEQIHRALTNLVTNAIDAACSKRRDPPGEERFADGTGESNPDDPGLDSNTARTSSNVEVSGSGQPPCDDQYNPAAGIEESSSFIPLVEIRTQNSPQTSTVLIIVDDNGPGIPPEEWDVLFRPFISRNKSSGTGLGLAVTNKIIHEHQGRVNIGNSPLGGARFVVELPLSPKTEKDNDEKK